MSRSSRARCPGIIAGLGFFYAVVWLPGSDVIRGTIAMLIARLHRSAISRSASVPSRRRCRRSAKSLIAAARISGADWWTTVTRIIVPMLKPALFSCFALLFIHFFKEYVTAVFLYQPGSEIIGSTMLQLYRPGRQRSRFRPRNHPSHHHGLVRLHGAPSAGSQDLWLISSSTISPSSTAPYRPSATSRSPFPKGEFLTLLGPSGCGKSTTLFAISGLNHATSGAIRMGDRVLFDGKSGTVVPPEQRNIGLVFQSYALWPHMSVAENLAFPLKLRKIGRAEQDKRIKEALELVEMAKFAERYPFELSGGQQQRVALARALVYRPACFLLDEPLSNLDAKLRERARVWLRELQERLGVTTVYVTHDQAEALAVSDRIAVMRHGAHPPARHAEGDL